MWKWNMYVFIMNSKTYKVLTTWFDNFKKELINNLEEDDDFDVEEFVENYKLPRFEKKTRNKTIIPDEERCCALISNSKQCSRRIKDDGRFCGTHQKGTPNGVIDDETSNGVKRRKKVEVNIINVNGVSYTVGLDGTVYDNVDILNNVDNPKKIGTCVEKEGDYELTWD